MDELLCESILSRYPAFTAALTLPLFPTFPTLCELCRRWAHARLCAGCVARHVHLCPRCARCGLRTGSAVPACGACLREPPPFVHTAVAVDYHFPWDRLIGDLKFHAKLELAQPLSRLMLDAFQASGLPQPAGVIPVPLSDARLRERGYNQAWELARRVAAAWRVPARADLIDRISDTPSQTQLTREQRLANLRTAFMPRREASAWLTGRRVLLVDDVMTTGATAREVTAALLRAGASSVDVLVAARTAAP
jgi:ComF family protein